MAVDFLVGMKFLLTTMLFIRLLGTPWRSRRRSAQAVVAERAVRSLFLFHLLFVIRFDTNSARCDHRRSFCNSSDTMQPHGGLLKGLQPTDGAVALVKAEVEGLKQHCPESGDAYLIQTFTSVRMGFWITSDPQAGSAVVRSARLSA